MKRLDDLLLLGNPKLYEKCEPVLREELHRVPGWTSDMHNVMEEIRERFNFGRGIAAPQLGIMKRLIYINIDEPVIIINPELHDLSREMIEVWDDCMCLPNLLVRVKRHRSLTLKYLDENWEQSEWRLTDPVYGQFDDLSTDVRPNFHRSQRFEDAVADASITEALEKQYVVSRFRGPDEMAKMIETEYQIYTKIMKQTGMIK